MRILGSLGRRVFQLLREIGSFDAKGEPDTKVFDARDGYVYTCLRSKEEFVSTMEMNILIGTRLADSSSFIDKVILIITLTPLRRASLSLSLSSFKHPRSETPVASGGFLSLTNGSRAEKFN